MILVLQPPTYEGDSVPSITRDIPVGSLYRNRTGGGLYLLKTSGWIELGSGSGGSTNGEDVYWTSPSSNYFTLTFQNDGQIIPVQLDAALSVVGEGLVFTSPNSTRFKLTVDDVGVFTPVQLA